jgi:hypothetical protein
MKAEYDFSNADRGKFFRPDTKFNLPIYLQEEVLELSSQNLENKGVDHNLLLNDLLKTDIDFSKVFE